MQQTVDYKFLPVGTVSHSLHQLKVNPLALILLSSPCMLSSHRRQCHAPRVPGYLIPQGASPLSDSSP
ncbi:hypothetical protein T11_10075 [Trichinella zimbabwensis]|uniref:Uncharacterized protein n=1 Tax=Trichinella zimbabwensis TaxID=268475 RepID=A0A0V1GCV0_9BILA|nr:hypothetical protein T11_10075 [Trichinella zimbabwensis]